MKILKSISDIKNHIDTIASNGNSIALVPTMGNLHQGHLSLIEKAKKDCDIIVASIFVNPTQFGINEDFEKYPRTLEQDLKKLEETGCDLVFTPAVQEMYSDNSYSNIVIDDLTASKVLCGKFRPDHLKGVLTVVLKLFNICRPNCAYFGAKDYQQFFLIKEMVKKLNLDININSCAIYRENDGLAMSSRNNFLNKEQRQKATQIYKSLKIINDAFKKGEKDIKKLKGLGMQALVPNLKLQYLEFANKETLQPVKEAEKDNLVAVAAYCGETRLIDNIIL